MPRQAIAHLQLQPSETAVLHAASRIFAALVAAQGGVDEANVEARMQLAIRLAIRMAHETDRILQSDTEEW